MNHYDVPDATRKLTIIANSIHGEKEIMWALRATDLILAIGDIRERAVRLRNDGTTNDDIAFGGRMYEEIKEVLHDYNLSDLLDSM